MISTAPTVNGACNEERIDAETASLDIAAPACPRMDTCASLIEVGRAVGLAGSVRAPAAAWAKAPFGAPRAIAVRSTIMRPGNSLAAVPAISPRTASLGARPDNVMLLPSLL